MILVLIDKDRERIYVPAQAELSMNMLHIRNKWKFSSIDDFELRSFYSPISDDKKAETIFKEAGEAFAVISVLHGKRLYRIFAYLGRSAKRMQRFVKSTKNGEYLSDRLE